MEQATAIEYHQAGRVRHKPTPSQDYLRERYDYDPESGALVLKKTGKASRHWTGSPKDKSRFRWVTRIGKRSFRHCRLVWAWHHGDPGSFQIDHIDGDRRNDRIENLRLATNSQNNAAKGHFKGYQSNGHKKFVVNVMKDQKNYRGGTYAREEDAAKAAAALRKALHGEFADTRLIRPSETLRAKTVIQMPLFD